ncbi:MAG: HAD family hydrolase, partial [Spartobacteria bacterium]|nr:HAD family hydrolase [Spartobacteria bacterium]
MNNNEHLISCIKKLSSPMSPQPTGMTPRVEGLEAIKVMLFDVYGTLFISGSGDIGILQKQQSGKLLADAMRATGLAGQLDRAARQGQHLFPACIQQVHQTLNAEGTRYPEVDIREIWQSVCGQLVREKLLDHVPGPDAIAQLAVEYECRVNPVWPMPHLDTLLNACRQKGIRMGIISNAQFFTPWLFDALTGQSLAAWGVEADLCVWSFELREAKPSTRLFQRLLDRPGLSPGHVLYIGNDIRNDIFPARQCGLKTALFAGDQRS